MPELDLIPVWISLKTAAVSTVITFFLGCAAARCLSGYQGRAKGLLDGLFTLPLVLPPTVVGFGLLLLFGKHGPLGKLLLKLGTTVIFSWWATVIAAAVVAFPLMYQTARGAFEQIEPNIENAARTLGASEWDVFWRVTVPLAWPGIMAGIILSFARALGEFGAPHCWHIPGRYKPSSGHLLCRLPGTFRFGLAAVILIIAGLDLALNYWRYTTNSC